MLSLPSIQKINLALSLLLLTGCADFNAGWNGYQDPYYSDPYAQSDFDELLAFGANMSKISSTSRAEVCRTLLKRQKNPPGAGIYLHLMVGRLLSDTCGDIPKILSGLNAIPPGSLHDERMQRFVAIHTEALKRLQNVSRKVGTLERKQKSVQSVLDSKDTNESKDTAGSKKDETRLLREKLEAIRSMEKHLDENSDAN
ncbi:MAG: hypothetical protein ACXW00_10195 [Methylobacter sp.]